MTTRTNLNLSSVENIIVKWNMVYSGLFTLTISNKYIVKIRLLFYYKYLWPTLLETNVRYLTIMITILQWFIKIKLQRYNIHIQIYHEPQMIKFRHWAIFCILLGFSKKNIGPFMINNYLFMKKQLF